MNQNSGVTEFRRSGGKALQQQNKMLRSESNARVGTSISKGKSPLHSVTPVTAEF
jgi:hypothetical protein